MTSPEGPAPGAASSWTSRSPAETEALGGRLALGLAPGGVVRLRGELGAGKTTLVRGAAAALGAHGPVRSPTFGLAHRHVGGRMPVHHLDLYRLASLGEEEEELVLDELPADGVAFVEWPEIAAAILAGVPGLDVELRHAGPDERIAVVRTLAPGAGEPG